MNDLKTKVGLIFTNGVNTFKTPDGGIITDYSQAMDKVLALLKETEEETIGKMRSLVDHTRLVCSAEQNGEDRDGCECARYNEAIDQVLWKFAELKEKEL